jgi:hypothetical protein
MTGKPNSSSRPRSTAISAPGELQKPAELPLQLRMGRFQAWPVARKFDLAVLMPSRAPGTGTKCCDSQTIRIYPAYHAAQGAEMV